MKKGRSIREGSMEGWTARVTGCPGSPEEREESVSVGIGMGNVEAQEMLPAIFSQSSDSDAQNVVAVTEMDVSECVG
jgi:hypothetical protein